MAALFTFLPTDDSERDEVGVDSAAGSESGSSVTAPGVQRSCGYPVEMSGSGGGVAELVVGRRLQVPEREARQGGWPP